MFHSSFVIPVVNPAVPLPVDLAPRRRAVLRPLRALALGCIGLFLTGCTTTDASRVRVMVHGTIALPPDETIIGLTASRPAPAFSLNTPTSRKEAAHEVSTEMVRGAFSDPRAIIIFPAMYLLGGIIGGTLGVSEADLQASVRSLDEAARGFQLETRMARAVMEQINSNHPGKIRALEDNIPLELKREPGRMRSERNGRLNWTHASPEPHPLADTEFATLIGLRVPFHGFQSASRLDTNRSAGINGFNPPLVLVLAVELSAIRVRDQASLGGISARYESLPHPFTEWAAGDAQLLRHEMDASLAELLLQIKSRLGHG